MKTKLIKLLPMLLTAALILALALTMSGCGTKSDAVTEEAAGDTKTYYASETIVRTVSTKENAIAAQPSDLTDEGYYAIGAVIEEGTAPEGAKAEYDGQFDTRTPCISFVQNDGTICVLPEYEPIQPESGHEGERDYRVTNSIELLKLRDDGTLVTVESVFCSWSEADKSVAYGSAEYYEKLGSENKYYIRVLDSTGAELGRGELEHGGTEPTFYQSEFDERGNIVSSQETGIVAFSTDGKVAYSIPVNGYVYSVANLRDGRVAALVYDFTSYEMNIAVIDSANGCFEEKTYAGALNAASLVSGAGDYDLYYSTGSSFFGFTLENEESSKLFSWINCDVAGSSLYKIFARDDGSVAAFSMNSSEDKESTTELIRISKLDADPNQGKICLRLATMDADDNTQSAVIDFNRTHENIRIDISDYSEYNTNDDYSAGETKLLTEIAAGDVPDLIELTPDIPYYRLASHGVLIDLYPLLDADRELSRKDFFENIFEAYEVNGGLYAAAPGFAIYTAIGAASVVGDEPGMTYDEYYAALSTMPEGCEGFDVGVDKSNMLSMYTALELRELVNWATGECRFDSDKFIRMLEFVNDFPPFDSENYEASPEDNSALRVAEGRQMLMTSVFTSVKYMLSDYDKLFGGKATAVGFPTDSGVGNMLYTINSMSITSACEEQEAAWEFARTYLTEEYQKKCYYIPTNKNVFEEELRDAMKIEYEVDANGNFRLDANGERIPKSYGYYYYGTQQVNVYAISQSQADMLRRAISDTTRLLNYDESIDTIITEGAEPYFSGQKSAQEVAKLIQSKINIYVNEQK